MRMYVFILLVCVVGCNSNGSSEQEKSARTSAIGTPQKITISDIPPELQVNGVLHEAWQWQDKLGENVLLLSRVAPYDDLEPATEEEAGQTAEIQAILFQKRGDRFEPAWTIRDAVTACPFDITCDFIRDAATVTDLDQDGFAEVKVQYALACRSDVSPATMKLVLYENSIKHMLEGLMWLPIEPGQTYSVTPDDVNLEQQPPLADEMEEMLRTFGRYKSEKDFLNTPPEFLEFARGEWLKYSKEKMGE